MLRRRRHVAAPFGAVLLRLWLGFVVPLF